MEISKLKKYLQNYLDSVATPRFNEEPNSDGIESFVVYDVLKGSYQPPIIHVFLDSLPTDKNTFSPDTKDRLRRLESDIKDFIKMFTIKNPVKVHLNKRPLFKSGRTYSTDI